MEFSLPLSEATMTDVVLKESCLISDWVPFSAGKCQTEGIEDAALGASVDQFFECFDGMRSSQSVLGSSGMWGWTSSVFSAITAASNLASGSLNISAEQQHVQTNLKITLVGVSMTFAFLDEDQRTQHGSADEQVDNDLNIHHLGLRWKDILIVVQVYPQEWKLEATVKHIVLDDYLSGKEDSIDFSLHDHEEDASSQILMIRGLQDRVQSALPPSFSFSEASKDVSNESNTVKVPSSLLSAESCACRNNTVKATVLQTSGAGRCMFTVSSKSNGRFTGQTSFSLELPPLIFWINFDLVRLVLDFSRELGNSSGKNGAGTDCLSEAFEENHDSSSLSDVFWNSNNHTTSTSGKGNLHGNIFLPHARVILCFPFKNGGGFRNYTSWDQFIALDFSCPPNFKKLKDGVSVLVQEETFWKKDSASTSHSVHLNVANLDVYHITTAAGENCRSSAELSRLRYCAHKILTLGNGTDWFRLISMLWHINAVTGAWIMKSAKLLATSDDPASKMSFSASGYEFASVSTKKDTKDLHSQKQKEMILSSKICLHVCLSSIVVTLCRSRYLHLFHLLNEVMDVFSSVSNDTASDNKETTVSQTSILLECGPMEVQIELDQGDCPRSSFERELPGSWHKLRLEIQKFRLLSVSDIGAVSGASFLWISHCEGKLWGSITTVTDQDLLLISCDDSASGRGDGEGSNILSCRSAGSDFVHMWDPEIVHSFISITVKCGTIVAPGGRLDWLDKISSFFSLPPPEIGQAADCNPQKEDSHRASFVLKFVDAALSYEPYSGNSECLNSKSSCSVSFNEKPSDTYIAGLLALSSLTLSNTTIAGSFDNDYCIRFQDVGLLLHAVSKHENVLVEYSADHLRQLGYVKIAGEALVNAILRINGESDISWELNCSESHIALSTCHDTTFGLMRLASQIQQLFAPDMEESIVHLQNRWNSLQQVQQRDGTKGELGTSSDCSPGTSQVQQSTPDSKGKSGLVGLMDEICEDAFLLCGKGVRLGDVSVLNIDEDLQNRRSSSTVTCADKCLEGNYTSNLQTTKLIEGYCLSSLRSLSELTVNSHFSEDLSKSKAVSRGNSDLQRGNSGWYGRTSLRIMENYVSDNTDRFGSKKLVKGQQNKEECSGSKSYKGRLLLKNVQIKWQMYAGSDWHELGKPVLHSEDIRGRDGTVCLELALSNMNIQYDIFPDGDICVSKLCVSIQDFFLYDKSRYAPWKLVLGYYHSKERPRESSSKAVKLKLEAVRPDPMTPLEEYRLRVACLPLLLHLHQSQLDFLIAFFGAKYPPDDQSQNTPEESGSSAVISTKDDNPQCVGIADEALLPFFQKFDIWPIILRVDYRPSRVDLAALSGGKYVELVNLVPWKGVELQLKHVQAAGVYGWSNVCETTLGEWLEDISRNQIHKLLQGLPPIRSFVAVGSGAAKLISLPVKNYRKDHRLVKGLQRGTVAFLRSISVEALGLGVHLAAGAHEILLHAECILTHIQPSVPRPLKSKLSNLRTDQPEDAQRGLQQAYESLSDGLGKTASALIRSPMKAYQRGGGVSSALATAVRGAPAAAIVPASAAAQAVHSALLGVRNSLDPEHKKESMNKYLGPSHPQERS